MGRTTTLAVMPLHVLSMGFSYKDVGLLATVAGVGNVLGNIPGGSLTGAHGPRFTYLVAMAALFASAGCAALANIVDSALVFYMFLLSFFLNGMTEAIAALARQTFTGAVVSKSVRGRASSAQGGMNRLGYVLGTSLGGMTAHVAGPGAAYALQAAASMSCAVVLLLCMPRISATQTLPSDTAKPQDLANNGDGCAGGSSLVGVAHRHWKLLAIAGCFSGCAFFGRKARELFFPLEGHAHGMSQAVVGHIAALSFLVDGALFPVAGFALDHIGRARTGAISFATMAISLFALQHGGEAALLTFAVLSGVSNGICSGLFITVGADLAPAHCRANFLALFRIIGRVSDPVAAAVVGTLADAASLRVSELAAFCVALGGLTCALCCMPETLQSASPDQKDYAMVQPEPEAAEASDSVTPATP
eukprot:CAMPEP_0170279302 /NCGR_PEP_ID=MMETSP0116_2-20130129/39662_1 /TAXON_ID=400756 /ORGANISM="Durinskia baltica, Strain CSIRO CS-38" /LENGTH=418 /DNA_ID=CAMNT_0010530627 /DNA_START=92 /DNA_END=1345 /DNA_ORIENTATION=+